MVRQYHVLNHSRLFAREARDFSRHALNFANAERDVPEELALEGIARRYSVSVGLNFIELFHVVNHNAAKQQIAVQEGIYFADAHSVHEHALHVVKQSAKLRMVIFCGRRIVEKPLLFAVQKL